MLAHVREYLIHGWPVGEDDATFVPYRCRRDELSVQDGCVLWGARVVIPPHYHQEVIQELHLAHPGINRMKSLARSYVWWPGMDKDLEKIVQRCDTCQLHNKSPPAAPLHPWEWPEKPWTRIHIDYAGPLGKMLLFLGKMLLFLGKMLLVAVDATSKWIETHIIRSTTSTATVNKLRDIFAQHGLLEVLVSDNATNFISEEFETFMRKNGIVHVTSAPYHPTSNGLGEQAVQTVKSGITKTARDNMEFKLQRFLFDYRRTLQSTTGKSPMEILNNRKMRSHLDLLHPSLQGKIHKKQKLMK